MGHFGGLARSCRIVVALVVMPAVLGMAAGCGETRSVVDGARARALTDRTFEATPARLERGRYLAENVLMCIRCHSEPDSSAAGMTPLAGTEGAGRIVGEDDGYRMVAPNLTPDSATGAGAWPDDALARAIREGVGHDGRALSRPMSWHSFRRLADEDLASVIVYLRSLPPVRNSLPERVLSPERLASLAEEPDPLTEPVAAPDFSAPIERGRYLIEVADCIGCHTSWHTDRMPGAFGGGNQIANSRTARVFSANITHDSSGIGTWSEETFIQVMRTGKGGTLDASMPWVVYRGMTDEDLVAIYRALGEAPHARHWIDNTSPPTHCPVCGREHGLGELNEVPERAAVPVPVDVLADYEGFYRGVYAEGGFYSNAGPGYPYSVEIRRRDGMLWATEGNEDGTEGDEPGALLPLSETRFFRPEEGEIIEFERDASGAVSRYRARFGLDEWLMRREAAVPNDNRTPAGTLRDGVLELDMEARPARWEGEKSDLDAEAANQRIVDVLGFAEAGGPVTIPGPLIRVPQGTEVRIRVRNSIPDRYPIGLPSPGLREDGMNSVADDVLHVRGLRAGTEPDDVLAVSRGEVAEVRYRADVPGTYYYWATPSSRSITAWTGGDAQLAGAIIVDPEGVAPDPEERIFVITMFDQYADPDAPVPQGEYFRRAINGRSWPDTERFEYAVGETVRWRWINASFEFHPMHLHGFHYRLLGRGDGTSETLFPKEARPLIVTEKMAPGGTFRMEWVPIRAGNWIFHCHLLDHIVPAIQRAEAEREHDLMDVEQHALDAMGGLVVGMTVTENGPEEALGEPHQRLRLVALEANDDDGRMVRGFGLEEPGAEAVDTPGVPGPPLLLTRGETTEIAVVNRLSEPTTIHWHGLELESVFDGVAGWSRTRSRVAPLIAPGDSFTVRINPPRAGTFIYHTHMDETDQLAQGMFGPFLVLEPGEAYDPEHDRVFVIGGQVEGDYPTTVNGHREPPVQRFRAGETYRLRFVHITRGEAADVALTMSGSPVRWRAVAKDGAKLPEALRLEDDAEFESHTGQTFDFLWSPAEVGDATLSVTHRLFTQHGEDVVRQTLRVR